jgi:uncharacterized coiled-coil protein SlyX
MSGACRFYPVLCLGLAMGTAVWGQTAPASDPALQAVIEQNRLLQEQVKAQQKTIESLSAQVQEIRRATERQQHELQGLQQQPADTKETAIPVSTSRDQEVRVAGEVGLAYFSSGRNGQFPNGEFRVDDATITLEAPVWQDVYFFSELKLLTRESSTASVQFGELYVDFERLGAPFGRPDALNLRFGSINTPFGEEYLVRGAVENPLVSHSLSDIWGPDEGVELYGSIGAWQYAVAVQNGGLSQLRDYHSSKSFAARLGWDPFRWLHLSASAMRTGKLATVSPVTSQGDNLSAQWFANGFFRSLGPASRTTNFWANLYEADAVAKWSDGKVSAAVGQVQFDDNDPLADNSRRLRYGYLEVMQAVTDHLYGATRYSAIDAPRGYPLAGLGNMGQYFFRPTLTEELRRLSFGFGYRFGPPLVLKLEYAWEWGRTTTGDARDHEDTLAAEVGLRF